MASILIHPGPFIVEKSQALGIFTVLVNHIYSLGQAHPLIDLAFSFLPTGFLVEVFQLNKLSQNLLNDGMTSIDIQPLVAWCVRKCVL